MVWGEVTPAERLRAVTHRRAGDDDFAAATADALAGFAADPASLVVACRQVLAHHADDAVLWWVCARLLAATDAAAAAGEAERLLNGDRTARHLAAHLPLLDADDVVAVIGWNRAVDDALVERTDVGAVAVRVDGDDPAPALRARRCEQPVRIIDSWDPMFDQVALVLVAARAIGPTHALVPAGIRDVRTVVRAEAPWWLVGGVGRVLPARIYEEVTRAVDVERVEDCTLEQFDRVATPRGLERPLDAAGRTDCPVVPELLRAR